jgi:hypothetical protein
MTDATEVEVVTKEELDESLRFAADILDEKVYPSFAADVRRAADLIEAQAVEIARKNEGLREGEAALDAAVRTINAPDGGDALDALQVVRGKIALRAALATTEPTDD